MMQFTINIIIRIHYVWLTNARSLFFIIMEKLKATALLASLNILEAEHVEVTKTIQNLVKAGIDGIGAIQTLLIFACEYSKPTIVAEIFNHVPKSKHHLILRAEKDRFSMQNAFHIAVKTGKVNYH